MKYFIGLTFHQNYLQFKKIASFRKRFDHKFSKTSVFQMTLLPPFTLNGHRQDSYLDLAEYLIDDIDTQLAGHQEVSDINFKGLEITEGRPSVIYLKPQLTDELFYCNEALLESIEKFGGQVKKRLTSRSELLSTLLPIGRCHQESLFINAVDIARNEFSAPFGLRPKEILLFEKIPGQWIPKKSLYTFPVESDHTYGDRYDYHQLNQQFFKEK